MGIDGMRAGEGACARRVRGEVQPARQLLVCDCGEWLADDLSGEEVPPGERAAHRGGPPT